MLGKETYGDGDLQRLQIEHRQGPFRDNATLQVCQLAMPILTKFITEVPYPASEEHTQILSAVGKRYAAGSPDDLSDPRIEASQGLIGQFDLQVLSECESEFPKSPTVAQGYRVFPRLTQRD